MSRIGIWIQFGKAESAQDAAARIGSKTGFVGEVIRLKDKNSTGPSVGERLAELEAKFRDATGVIFEAIGKHDQSRAAAERRFLAIEAEHAALVERIGDLEREPVASPPATTEPTPSGAAEDRLAKVATDDDLLDLFERAECASCDTRAARRALYDIGRESAARELAAMREERNAVAIAVRARASMADRELRQWASRSRSAFSTLASRDLIVADWQKQREELDTIRAALPSQFKGLDLDTVSAVDLCVGTMSKALNEAAASRKTWRERAILLAERAGRLRADRDVAVQARDVAEAENAALRNRRAADLRLLGRLVHHMYIEGQQGDGIPESAWDDYQKAKALAAAIAELPKDASPARTWEEERADAVAFWTKHIDGHPRDYAALGPVLDQFETGGHIGAAARAKTPEKASDAEPTEAEMARELPKAGPTPEPTEDEMAAELREAGWSEGSGWRSPRDTLFAWHRYTADAYAAMRAAKGAK